MNYDFKTLWSVELYKAAGIQLTLGNVLVALILLLITTRISRLVAGLINKRFIARIIHDTDAQATYTRIIYSILLIIMVCISLTVAGIPLTIFSVIGGALAIGIGFGSQNIIKNFISGVILRLEKQIRIGDIISIDGVSGKVVSISTRSTKIRNAENKIHIVPNSFFLEKMVLNSNIETTVYRTTIDFYVNYSTNPKKVEEICYQVLSDEKGLSENPAPAVQLFEFLESKMQFRLIFFVNSALHSQDDIKSILRLKLFTELERAGIEINPTLPVPVKINN